MRGSPLGEAGSRIYAFGFNLDPTGPAPGQVLFYLYKFCNGSATCSYGQTSSGAERTPSSGACP